jgi:hypothetical protein
MAKARGTRKVDKPKLAKRIVRAKRSRKVAKAAKAPRRGKPAKAGTQDRICPICGSGKLVRLPRDSAGQMVGKALVQPGPPIPLLVIEPHARMQCQSCGWTTAGAT